ncbi:MAG: hypothetical protein M0T70_05515 [Geobacteraceae bacterium]|nr:hypothetical protein [Geobacteraceae bacterium]
MSEEYTPSPDFVAKVMVQVRAYEASRISFAEWFIGHPFMRYALAGGGTLFGIFKSVAVF